MSKNLTIKDLEIESSEISEVELSDVEFGGCKIKSVLIKGVFANGIETGGAKIQSSSLESEAAKSVRFYGIIYGIMYVLSTAIAIVVSLNTEISSKDLIITFFCFEIISGFGERFLNEAKTLEIEQKPILGFTNYASLVLLLKVLFVAIVGYLVIMGWN